MSVSARAFFFLFVGCASCTETDGVLAIDGEAREIEGCRSAVPDGWDAVDIQLDQDQDLRLYRADGQTPIVIVGYFDDPASNVGIIIGDCVVGEIRDQSTSTNGVVHREGEAVIDCDAPIAVQGDLSFSNCH